MRDEILVSIVLPFFNGKEFIGETLESIAKQTFANFEVVIVDDGSTKKEHSEHLKAVIGSLGDPRFKYLYKSNGGLSDARNHGLKAASGSWIGFIDQDDVWDEKKLEKQISVVKAHPEADFIFTDGKTIGDRNENLNVAAKNGLKEGLVVDTRTRLMKGNFVICSSVLFSRGVLEKTGFSNSCFRIIPDYEYMLRFAAHTDFYFISDRMVSYRIHGANTVKNELKQSAEVVSLLCDLNLTTSRQKVLATYNMARNILTLGACWAKKILMNGV